MITRHVRAAVEKTAYFFDKLYEYALPPELGDRVMPGCRVQVPFGPSNRRHQAVVFELTEPSESEGLKTVSALLDGEPVLSAEQLMLAKWLSESCFCTLFECAKLMMPVGLGLRLSTGYSAAPGMTMDKLDQIPMLLPEQVRIMSFLISSSSPVESRKLCDLFGIEEKSEILSRLEERGLITGEDMSVRRIGDKNERMVRLTGAPPAKPLTPKQQEVVSLLEQEGFAGVKEICYFTSATQSVVSTLEKNGIVEFYDREVYRHIGDYIPGSGQKTELVLTDEQSAAYKNILSRYREGRFTVNLLYGVTGSGKTSVFMRLIDDVLSDGRAVIVMVPEIALTPQTLDRFRSRYGGDIAILHSGLSLGQRLDEWKRIKRGQARLVVGTRSAVFAPCENLGLIIIDEEQEYTYKSESSPRYHARDAARFRCAYNKTALLLCSATPSLESFYYAQNGKYYLETLSKRYGDALLPTVDVVDISGQRLSENIISPELKEAIAFNLEQGYQSILLHNRRGYNTFVACRACGHVLFCEQCSVSMTYHYDNNRLMCHHCGSSMPFVDVCPECGQHALRYAGQGTQRVEDELAHLFPNARVLRMDADSTMTRYSHADKLASFAAGDYDIMIGTQMVAKGLDFAKVTLVGVLLADQTLCSDDFRSYERAFSLLTQVVGRSGRGRFAGRAIIQTLSPDNPIFNMAAQQNYTEFYDMEIKMRRALLNPPFSDICLVGFVGEDEQKTKAMSIDFVNALKELASSGEYSSLPMRVLGPSPAQISRLMNKYRYRIIIKCRNSADMRSFISSLLRSVGGRREYKDVTVFADMNPDNPM